MALDISKFVRRFVDEAREHLARLEAGIGALTTAGDLDRAQVDALFRAAHTIKGSARMLKLATIAETAHHLEEVLGALREGRIQPDAELGALMMRAVDTLGTVVEQLAVAPENRPVLDAQLCDGLLRAAAGERTLPPPAMQPPSNPSPAATGRPVDSTAAGSETSGSGPPAHPDAAPRPTPSPTAAATGLGSADSVRVRMDKLDALVKLMGEIVSMQGRLRDTLRQARALEAAAQSLAAMPGRAPLAVELATAVHAFTSDLRDLTREQERLSAELNDRTLGMRMLPLGTVLDPLARVARELGRTLGKAIRCEVTGSEIALDRQIVDRLSDVLVHLLRNAIDHGIENSETRLAAGKSAIGCIRVSARQEGGAVLITIADDGGGLDRERILERAIQKGLIEASARAQISDEQIADLIFQPGFSTSTIVTEVSGRGVGMDVVRRTVTDDLHGSVTITSRAGVGMTTTLTLPLSLAVMRVLLLESAGHCFGITAPHVAELIRTTPAETIQVAGRPAVILRNELIPLIPLADLIGLPRPDRADPKVHRRDVADTLLVVVIGVRQAKLGLVVDALIDERDMVLKPLPAHLRTGSGGNGGRGLGLVGAILITGSNTLVSLLQAPALLDAARHLRGEAIAAAARDAGSRSSTRRAYHILVVDDSLNTREIEQAVLEASGYRVTLAEDGLDGWQKALGGQFDAILTDVEMPGLDGFSLTAKLRESDKYRTTPIVIVSSRHTSEDKQRGIQVGADAYIVKGDFDQSTLVDTLGNLLG